MPAMTLRPKIVDLRRSLFLVQGLTTPVLLIGMQGNHWPTISGAGRSLPHLAAGAFLLLLVAF